MEGGGAMKLKIGLVVVLCSVAGFFDHDTAVKIIAWPIASYIAWRLLKRWALWKVDRNAQAMRREFARARQRREWEEED